MQKKCKTHVMSSTRKGSTTGGSARSSTVSRSMPTLGFNARRSRAVARRSSKIARRPRRVARIHHRRRIAHPTKALGHRWENALALKKLYKFKYADTAYDLSPDWVLASPAYHVWAGNSLYDPDVTGVGVQPYMFDQLCTATVFNYYTVFASKITVTFMQTTTDLNALVCTIVPATTATLSYDAADDLRVMPHAYQRRFDENKHTMTMSHYMTFDRITPWHKEDRDNVGSYNSNPTVRWFWHVLTHGDLAGADPHIFADIKITYYARLTRTNDMDES